MNYTNLMHMNEYKLRRMLSDSDLPERKREKFLDAWYARRKEIGIVDDDSPSKATNSPSHGDGQVVFEFEK